MGGRVDLPELVKAIDRAKDVVVQELRAARYGANDRAGVVVVFGVVVAAVVVAVDVFVSWAFVLLWLLSLVPLLLFLLLLLLLV